MSKNLKDNLRVARSTDDPLWRHRGNPSYVDHDAFGFQSKISLEKSNVLLTGSSHIYGVNLEFDQTWPHRLKLKSGASVYNASMPAWSAMQYALVTQGMLRSTHELAVVCLYTGFDIYGGLKHSLQTQEAGFSKFALEGLGAFREPEWQGRIARDHFIKNGEKSGQARSDLLRAAFAAGHADCLPVEMGKATWWLEPNLRFALTNLKDDYLSAAFTVTARYCQMIADLCKKNGTRLLFVLFPTKEYVVGRSIPENVRPDILEKLIACEDDLVSALQVRLMDTGANWIDLTHFYLSVGPEAIFDGEPFQGHPSARGAEKIAAYMGSVIDREFISARVGKQPASEPTGTKRACNICGSIEFELGPGGRTSMSGAPPQCSSCKSLERHRAARQIFGRLDPRKFKTMKALQFGDDPSIDRSWFKSYRMTTTGTNAMTDIEKIESPDANYDFVFLCHLLEFVADDQRGFAELARILSPDGILIDIAITPFQREITETAESSPGAIRRRYGADRHTRFRAADLGLTAIEIDTADPVTGQREVVDFYVKSAEMIDMLKALRQPSGWGESDTNRA